ILQDEFLTSSESNIRNLQYGMKDSAKWGNMSKVGYFPDSFGNMGQAPQILRQAGINNAVFGRGVKPTGFNNKVSNLMILNHLILKCFGAHQMVLKFTVYFLLIGIVMVMKYLWKKKQQPLIGTSIL